MKKIPLQNNRWLAGILFTLLSLLSGCAPTQVSGDLQQQLTQLLAVQQQQAQQLAQLQQQLASLSGIAPQGSTSAVNAVSHEAPPQPSEQKSATQGPDLQPPTEISAAAKLYLEAFASIATGQMAAAQANFEKFIQQFPEHEYIANANYWLAEALFGQQQNEHAIALLRKIIDTESLQTKAPAAAARLVDYYQKNEQTDQAAPLLQLLKTKYPDSPELKRLTRFNPQG